MGGQREMEAESEGVESKSGERGRKVGKKSMETEESNKKTAKEKNY